MATRYTLMPSLKEKILNMCCTQVLNTQQLTGTKQDCYFQNHLASIEIKESCATWICMQIMNKLMTPEAVRDNWNAVTNFDNPRYVEVCVRVILTLWFRTFGKKKIICAFFRKSLVIWATVLTQLIPDLKQYPTSNSTLPKNLQGRIVPLLFIVLWLEPYLELNSTLDLLGLNSTLGY